MARTSTRRERSDHPPWPRGDLRDPIRSDPDYLHLRSLSRLLKETAERELWGREGLILVDVGCDEKPYYPYFAPFVAEYRGVEVGPRSSGGGSGRAERLNFQDASVDVILCTQVLEHTDDPIEAVKEFRRVLKADEVAFVSTHGAYVYHPAPTYDDYWRWTGPGLEKLFRDFGGFEIVDVYSCGGSFSCLSSLLGVYHT